MQPPHPRTGPKCPPYTTPSWRSMPPQRAPPPRTDECPSLRHHSLQTEQDGCLVKNSSVSSNVPLEKIKHPFAATASEPPSGPAQKSECHVGTVPEHIAAPSAWGLPAHAPSAHREPPPPVVHPEVRPDCGQAQNKRNVEIKYHFAKIKQLPKFLL